MLQVFKYRVCFFFFLIQAELQNSECRAELGAQTLFPAISPWTGHSSIATDGHEFIFKNETFCIF